jgi:hypothetical protein
LYWLNFELKINKKGETYMDKAILAAMSETDKNRLDAAFTNIASGDSATVDTKVIRDTLNKIFPTKTCVDVMYTENTDKMFFGIMINPTLTPNDLVDILFSDKEMEINRYMLEIDSKLFSAGLEASEISAYLLHEVSSLVLGPGPINEVRSIIDLYIANEDEAISIKDSVNYSQILIFAIKDALIKITSSTYKEDVDDILSNEFINSANLRDSLMSALIKARSSVFGIGSTVKDPNLVLIKWAFNLYRDVKHNGPSAIETLKEAMGFTGSKLLKAETDRTIKSLQRINTDVMIESARIMREAKSGGSLFGNIKKNGLRAIEDDLYEYTIRVKNAETEEDAYYALRQINSRINLLEDYIYNTEGLSEAEIKKWREVALRYRDLREQLSRKKIVDKRQYGLFFNYDALDELK